MQRQSSQVRVYTPEAALLHPLHLLNGMFRDLWNSRELAWRLFVRDTSARYRQSVFGWFWAWIPLLVTTLTFVLLNKGGIIQPGKVSVPYPIFALIGILLWQSFTDALNGPMKALTSARTMLVKLDFPREALLVAALLEVLLNVAIRSTLLVPLFAYYSMGPAATAHLALGGLIAIIVLGFVIGLLLTPLALLYMDISQGLALILGFWMLITPVLYNLPSEGPLATFSKINPLAPLVATTRNWLVTGTDADGATMLTVFAVSVLLLFAGWVLYRLAMPMLVERLGN